MNAHPPVLIIGGTRGTGLLIARLLGRRGREIRVLARDPARARRLFEPAVEIVPGDVTRPDTLPPAIEGAAHIVFTAGCRSGHPAREPRVRATEYDGVLHTLDAARRLGFPGRFLYMTSSGVLTRSLFATCLNLWKGNTLVWRRRAEDGIRASGLEYTIVRTGVLLNAPGGEHVVRVTQDPLPLSLRHRIARADVADLFAAALEHARVARTTLEIVWAGRGLPGDWGTLLDDLRSD